MGRVVIPGFRKIEVSGGGEGGTTNYEDLTNKPSINNVPLVGNLRTVDLKLTDATLTEEGVPAEAKTVGTKLEEQATSLTALSEQLGSHTVKSDVPENAVFTDTIYDYSALLGYDIYNLVSLKDATYPANKTWLSIDFIAPFDGYIFFMVQTDATSGAFTQVLREDDVLISNNQKNIADFNTWGEAYRHQIYKGKTYHFGSYNNTATAFNKVMLCIRKKLETPTEYVPYAPSNVALAEKTTNLDKRISDNGYGEVAGGKNLIPYEDMNNLLSNMSDNADGTTHSYSDGVLSINRVANVNSGVYVYSSIFKRFDNKKIKISFDAKSSVNGMVLSISLNSSAYSYTPILTSEYKRYSVEVVAGDTAHNFIIYGNTVAGEVNIKNVMFSEAVYNDTSYEPYFPSNKMLAEEIDEINSNLEQLEETVSYVSHGKNLIGTELNKLYPVYIKANEKVVSSRYDGQVTSILDKGIIAFYGKNKEPIIHYSVLLPDTSYRVFTMPEDVYYIAWEILPSVDFQVEIGDVATSYEPYNQYGNKQCLLDIKNDLGGLSFSVSGTTLSITDGTNTWTLTQ